MNTHVDIIGLANTVVGQLLDLQVTQTLDPKIPKLGIDIDLTAIACMMKIKRYFGADTVLSAANVSKVSDLVVADKLLPSLTRHVIVTQLNYPDLVHSLSLTYNAYPHSGLGVVPPKGGTSAAVEVDYGDVPTAERAKSVMDKNPWLLLVVLITIADIDYVSFVEKWHARSVQSKRQGVR